MRWYKDLAPEERLAKLMLLERGETDLGIEGVSVTVIPADPIIEITGPDGSTASIKTENYDEPENIDELDDTLTKQQWYDKLKRSEQDDVLHAITEVAEGRPPPKINGVNIVLRTPRPIIVIEDKIASAEVGPRRIKCDLEFNKGSVKVQERLIDASHKLNILMGSMPEVNKFVVSNSNVFPTLIPLRERMLAFKELMSADERQNLPADEKELIVHVLKNPTLLPEESPDLPELQRVIEIHKQMRGIEWYEKLSAAQRFELLSTMQSNVEYNLQSELSSILEQLHEMPEAKGAATRAKTDVVDIATRVLAAKHLMPRTPAWMEVKGEVKVVNPPEGMKSLQVTSDGFPRMRLAYDWMMDILGGPNRVSETYDIDMPDRMIRISELGPMIRINLQLTALGLPSDTSLNKRLELISRLLEGQEAHFDVNGETVDVIAADAQVSSAQRKVVINLNEEPSDGTKLRLTEEYAALRTQVQGLPLALSEAASLEIDADSLARRALIAKHLMSEAEWQEVVESFRTPQNGKTSPVPRGWILHELGNIDSFSDPLAATMKAAKGLVEIIRSSSDSPPDSGAEKRLMLEYYTLYEQLAQMTDVIRFAADRGITVEKLTASLLARKHALSSDEWREVVRKFSAGERVEKALPVAWIRSELDHITLGRSSKEAASSSPPSPRSRKPGRYTSPPPSPRAAGQSAPPPPSPKPVAEPAPASVSRGVEALSGDELWEKLEQSKIFKSLDEVSQNELRTQRSEISDQLLQLSRYDHNFRATFIEEDGRIIEEGFRYVVRLVTRSGSGPISTRAEERSRSEARERAEDPDITQRSIETRGREVVRGAGK